MRSIRYKKLRMECCPNCGDAKHDLEVVVGNRAGKVKPHYRCWVCNYEFDITDNLETCGSCSASIGHRIAVETNESRYGVFKRLVWPCPSCSVDLIYVPKKSGAGTKSLKELGLKKCPDPKFGTKEKEKMLNGFYTFEVKISLGVTVKEQEDCKTPEMIHEASVVCQDAAAAGGIAMLQVGTDDLIKIGKKPGLLEIQVRQFKP